MGSVVSIEISRDGYTKVYLGDVENQFLTDKTNNFTFNQFTGLKDRKGVEIYEGDIVAVQYDFDEPTIHLVEWGGVDYPAFELSPQLDCECNGFAHYYNDPDTIIEVIGNIHQNPELPK